MAEEQGEAQVRFPALDPGKPEIRVLEIKPGKDAPPLECKYKVVNLDDTSLSYEALSYVWGNPHPDDIRLLDVDDCPVEITPALLDAIHQLRLPDRSRCMWIDALCINQADDEEKTQQVNMMDQIYTKCVQSVVWLGHLGHIESADAETLFTMFHWLGGEEEEPEWTQDTSTCEAVGRTLKTFMRLPWWYRIWTVQEGILPSRATMLWGHLSIDLATLFRASDSFFNGADRQVPTEICEDGAVNDLTASLRGLDFSRHEGMLQLFVRWRFRHATDPRDKVYALMGFRDDLALPTVKSCDYSIDVRTLFKRITADLIRSEGSLLPLIGRRGEVSDLARGPEGFPSWVVDWVEPVDPENKVMEYWTHECCVNTYEFSAGEGLRGVADELRMIGEDVLCLSGLFVDRVAVVEDPDNDRAEADCGMETVRAVSVVERWEEVVVAFQTKHPDVLRRGWVREFCSLALGSFTPQEGDLMDEYVGEMLQKQCLFITEGGKFGVGPKITRPGDELWVVGGSAVPFLLARQGDEQDSSGTCLDFRLVADCLVYGIMYGEAVEGREADQVEFRLH